MDVGFDTMVPSDDGRWVSENFERLARVVQDYDPAFELRWIPPESRETPDERAKPYVVWNVPDNCPYFFASELDTPADILTKLFEGDNRQGDVLARLDAHNNAIRALQMKEQMDLAEERQDYVEFLMRTKKNFIELGNGRKVDDQLRPLL
jgi:hypothetical protein